MAVRVLTRNGVEVGDDDMMGTAAKLKRIETTKSGGPTGVWVGIFLSSCLVLLLGCDPPRPAQPEQEGILRALGLMPQDLAQSSNGDMSGPEEPLKQLRIYIDASGSMRGFLGHSGSRYYEVLDRFFKTAARLSFQESYFRFGTQVETVSRVVARDALSPGFYSYADTDLTALLARIASGSGDDISIVVSDLVESIGRRAPERLIATLRDLTERYPGTALLAFRSSFCCSYWIESDPARRGQKFPLSLDGRGEHGRPFYLLVIAPSEESLEQVRWRLLNRLDAVETFHASAPALEFEAVSYAPNDDGDVVWNVWRRPAAVDSSDTYLSYFFERQPPRSAGAPLRLRFEVHFNLPFYAVERVMPRVEGLRDVNRLQHPLAEAALQIADLETAEIPAVNAESPSVNDEGNEPPAVMGYDLDCTFVEGTAPSLQPPAPKQTSGGMEHKIYDLTCMFPRPAAFTWDAYRIRATPGEGNLQPPAWVEEWSTGIDVDPGQGNRTLDLSEFVLAMLNAVTENSAFLDQIIVIGRGE